jgi:hypothetical protein
MKTDKNDIQLIRAVHTQYHAANDEKIRKGLRYVLKDILGRYLLQIKHYEPWASQKAKDEAKKKLSGIPLSQVKLHDCNVKNPAKLSDKQKKLFVNKNTYNKSFHLEHDPPTIQVANSILDKKNISDTEIKKALESYRLCFITVKENDKLKKKGFDKKRPLNAYKKCSIVVKQV